MTVTGIILIELTGASFELNDRRSGIRRIAHELVVHILCRGTVPLGVVAAVALGAVSPERAANGKEYIGDTGHDGKFDDIITVIIVA